MSSNHNDPAMHAPPPTAQPHGLVTSKQDASTLAASHRIHYLDGLRGIAISIVVAFHYYGPTYAAYLPFGKRFSEIPILGQGWAGVHLFFLISGFVIFRTLERCDGFVEFLIRRWIRLVPAFLAAAALIVVAHHLLAKMPSGAPDVKDILLGPTFVSPAAYHAALRIDVNLLDGAYWTLIVEFSFYVAFGIMYFWLGSRRALIGLTALWIVTIVGAHHPLPFIPRATEPLVWTGCQYFGWFVSGALYYRAHQSRSLPLFLTALAVALASAATDLIIVRWDDRVALAAVAILFAAAQKSIAVQRIVGSKPLFFIGTISYPLYLIHNDIGIGLIATIADATALNTALIPLVVLTIALTTAWLIHRYFEPVAARFLKARLLRRRA